MDILYRLIGEAQNLNQLFLNLVIGSRSSEQVKCLEYRVEELVVLVFEGFHRYLPRQAKQIRRFIPIYDKC